MAIPLFATRLKNDIIDALSSLSSTLYEGVTTAAAAKKTYTSIALGLADTVDGESFYVAVGGEITLYRNDNGVAAPLADLATGADVAARPTYTELASTAPGEGAGLVGFLQDGLGAVGRTVEDKLRDTVNAADWGVAATASAANNSTYLQAAIDYARENACKLILPAGEIEISGSVTIPPSAANSSDHLFTMKGQGASKVRGTFLHFTSGSLIVEAVHHIEGIFVTSDDSDGVVVTPHYSPDAFPARSSMRDVRAERCAGSGIVLTDNWIYVVDNCYGRYNKSYGLEGRHGAQFGISCNGLTIIGGEFQGNGTKQGDPVGSNGSTERGTGGGILLDGAVQVNIIGSSIEGNIGDGLRLGEEVRGLSIINGYFEKNGSHHTNRDICNDPPSIAALGPTSVRITGTNHTAQNYNGTKQERAIELYDVDGLYINGMFVFGSSGSSFTEEPVYVGETLAGRALGWIDGIHSLWTGYDNNALLKNETRKYGKPMVHQFTADTLMPKQNDVPENVDTDSAKFYVRTASHYGTGVDVDWDVRPVTGTGNGAGQVARIETLMQRGPSGTLFSGPATSVPVDVLTSTRGAASSSHASIPDGSAELTIRRAGTNAADTAAGSVRLVGARIIVYAGIVSANTKA